MKYTVDELFSWVKEDKELYRDIITAMYNNRRGWGIIPCDGIKGFVSHDGENFLVVPMINETGAWQDEELLIDLPEGKTIKELNKQVKILKAMIIVRGDEYSVILNASPNAKDELMELAIKEFINFCKCDTKGKIRKVIEEGWDEYSAFMHGQRIMMGLSLARV